MAKEKEKDYLTPAEAIRYIGIARATLYTYIEALNIKPVKMGPDGRKRFLALADVKRMKAYKEQPWTITTMNKSLADLWNQLLQKLPFGSVEKTFRSKAGELGFSEEEIFRFLEELERETTPNDYF